MTTNSAAANAGLITNSTTTTPARKLFDKIEFKDTETKKRGYLEKIVLELEQAQVLEFSLQYRYIKVGVVLIEAKKELKLKDEKWKEFYSLLGLKNRVEERYRQIASNKWFAELTEEDAPKLHHLTQANMITMSKEKKDEEKFKKMLNSSDYNFSAPEKTDDEVAEAFQTAYDKAELKSISIEDYKEYCASSISSLIKILDETLFEVDEAIEVDEPSIVSAQLKNQSIGESQSSDKTSKEA